MRGGARLRAGLLSAFALMAGFGVCCCSGAEAPPPAAGLFSWSSSTLEGPGRERLLSRMEELKLGEIYQYFSGKTEAETVRGFVAAASQKGIAVYLLTGEPEWGLDRKGREMIEEIARAASYNEGAREEERLAGVMMDTEPYLTGKWEKDPDHVMESYVAAMERAHQAAQEQELHLAACIPYFYDTKGQEKGLEKLVARGCDSLAVMNYNKRKELENAETEVELARACQKPVRLIYELQRPGKHDLTERNTYFGDGLEAVEQSFAALSGQLQYDRLSYALHDFKSLEEMEQA